MNHSLISNLKNTGLSEKAALVYAAVLETGVAYPSNIAQTTKLNRSTVYHILEMLRTDGLVTQIERNKKMCYQIEDPARLRGYARQQIDLAEAQYEQAQKIIPELEGLFSQAPNKPRVRFFEGREGILTILQEHVSQKEPYAMESYSNVEQLMKYLPSAFIKRYIKQKEKIGITTRAILPDTPYAKRYNANIYQSVSKSILVKSRYISAEAFPYEADITMFGSGAVSMINFHKDVPIGVIIEDPTIYGMMRMAFDLAWKGAA